MKAINMFCKMITRKILAIKVNTSIAQKSKWSLWVHWPFIQKYAASIAVKKDENGLSFPSSGLKSDLSVILKVSFIRLFVATPLNVESLVAICLGSLSKTNLHKWSETNKIVIIKPFKIRIKSYIRNCISMLEASKLIII